MCDDWRFAAKGNVWRSGVAAAPTEETKRDFWQRAIPHLAVAPGEHVPDPCVVVAHIRARAHGPTGPTGPRGRAKRLLDALHDDRRSGPFYRDLGLRSPLVDDKPRHVRGLTVEVRVGTPHTEYFLGNELSPVGELLAAIPVDVPAPNDIIGTPEEKAVIERGRTEFATAVRSAAQRLALRSAGRANGLVVRHLEQRDEDNTWMTWVAAICGIARSAETHWSSPAPLAGWVPNSIASVSDVSLSAPVVYELWS